MARHSDIDHSSDDEFPDIHALLSRPKKNVPPTKGAARDGSREAALLETGKGDRTTGTVRRRKLGMAAKTALLEPWNAKRRPGDRDCSTIITRRRSDKKAAEGLHLLGEDRTARKLTGSTQTIPDVEEEDDAFLSAREELTVVEEVTIVEDDFSSNDDSSDSDFRGDDSDFQEDETFMPLPKKQASPRKLSSRTQPSQLRSYTVPKIRGTKLSDVNGVTESLSRLQVDDTSRDKDIKSRTETRARTPPTTLHEARPVGLSSPKKLPRIPATPHHPSSDMFWSREFVDEWNEEHSPRKQLFPAAPKSPAKTSPAKAPPKASSNAREAKRAFEKARHQMAEDFLRELDNTITKGKISELAGDTGGVKISWTNKLCTTAGRANWKREVLRTKAADGRDVSVKHRHHATIELADKVIDSEDRLLNVIAHEFCHLANFMVTGITTNPHGKEFKAWAAKCSRAFGHRGIQVTTKHSYDIDFKYVWECGSCGAEYKRHSKSINVERHRCGTCKGELKQTRPVPRAAGKPSEYQKFMKVQMKVLKEENPGSPQKDILRLVADRWARESKSQAREPKAAGPDPVESMIKGMGVMTLSGKEV